MTNTEAKTPLTKKQRVEYLTAAIENGDYLSTGDQIIGPKVIEGRQQTTTIVMFTRKPHEDDHTKPSDDVFLATPNGIVLFEANEFYEYCQEKAKQSFLNVLDDELRRKKKIIDIKVPAKSN